MAECKCIGCDTPIPSGSDQCPMCGAKAKHQTGKSETSASSPAPQKIITVEKTTESAKKKCHKCAMMIPKEASICPHCRKTQGMTLTTKLFLALIAVAILANILPHNKPNDTQSEKQTVTSQPPVSLTVAGKVVKNNHPTWDMRTAIQSPWKRYTLA